jgi:hypothetical protein
MAHSEAVRKLLEHLQSDLKNISLEAKRRHPGVKESAEEAIVKERTSFALPYSVNRFNLEPIIPSKE